MTADESLVIADLLGETPYLVLQSLVDAGWGPGARNYFTS